MRKAKKTKGICVGEVAREMGGLEVEDKVGGGGELIAVGAVVVGG